tara:strand:+ start:68 stop:577 length:510 start_codon:yes stop_codon:yes gene_type:complete
LINRHQFEDLISDYVEGNISRDNKDAFEEWILNNPEDGELVRGIKKNILAMKNFNKVIVSRNFNERLNEKITKNIKKKRNIKTLMFGFNKLNFTAFIGMSFSLIFLITIFASINLKKNNSDVLVTKSTKIIKVFDKDTNYADTYKDSLDLKNNNNNIKKHSGNMKFVSD